MVCFSIGTTVLLLLILEILIRLVVIETSPTIDVGMQMVPHPTRIWAMSPGITNQFGVDITIDDNGLRQTSSRKNKWSVLTIGDSSIFGHGVSDEDTLHEHLANSFEQRSLGVDVLCAGVPGYSSIQSSRLLEEIGWELQPDVLVIASLWSDNNFDHFVDQELIEILDSPLTSVHVFLSQSSMYRMLNKLLQSESMLQSESIKEGNQHSKISWIREPYEKGRRRVPVWLYGRTLDSILKSAGERSISVVMLQPANKYRVIGMSEEATWDIYFQTQRDIAEHRGIPILDAAEVLRMFGIDASQAFLDELHPTGISNKWVANAIVDVILQKGWPVQSFVPDISVEDWAQKPNDKWEYRFMDTNIGQDQPR
jgi:hypothetical protein